MKSGYHGIHCHVTCRRLYHDNKCLQNIGLMPLFSCKICLWEPIVANFILQSQYQLKHKDRCTGRSRNNDLDNVSMSQAFIMKTL